MEEVSQQDVASEELGSMLEEAIQNPELPRVYYLHSELGVNPLEIKESS